MTENKRREAEMRSIMNAVAPKEEAKKEEKKPAKNQTKGAKK